MRHRGAESTLRQAIGYTADTCFDENDNRRMFKVSAGVGCAAWSDSERGCVGRQL
jgi:hypothetical protein